ncbi:MAG: hypothetical protein MUC93_13455 [Bacteroidales bacterium]|jgi:hypothetical protein|nr:hypothetical protein [Bacteroidales bacterium]
MRSYNLNIAGYRIKFESPEEGPELVPSERFLRNICNDVDSDLLIRVHTGKYKIPGNAEKVFSAPYVEEINGIQVKKSDRFWSIHKHQNDLFIKTLFPLSPKIKKAVLKYSLNSRDWDLWIEGSVTETDPMEYPLDGLILYYLTVIHGDIMIHASGINNAGRGYLFSGVSGKGKTTMAKLWDNSGARVIHDDRLIIRHSGSGGFVMHNTPVYRNDIPLQSALNKIFLIEHGKKNELIPVRGAGCISLVMTNCIQHNWNPEIIARLLGSVSIMCSVIPTSRLLFKPDRSVIDIILENE